ncbi:MAG: TatD family hydrolase [Bacteroidota bacterium]
MERNSENIQFIDIHTHSLSGYSDQKELISFFHKSHIPNTSFFSIGIHPWHAEKASTDALLDQLYPKAYKAFAIGECGLDKASSSNWDKQVEVFKTQIEISEKLRKPLIIHAVKTYPDIIALHKEYKPEQAWIIHGFTGNLQNMKACTNHGIYLSYGALLMRGIESFESVLKQTPNDLLFLETDESNIEIRRIYERAAHLKNISLDTLAIQIENNLKSIQHR